MIFEILMNNILDIAIVVIIGYFIIKYKDKIKEIFGKKSKEDEEK